MTTLLLPLASLFVFLAPQTPPHEPDGTTTQVLALPAGRPSGFTVALEFGGTSFVVDLHAHSVRVPGFAVAITDAAGRVIPSDAPAESTYRGLVRDRAGWRVAASLEPDGLYAHVLGPRGEAGFFVQPARALDPNAPAGLHRSAPSRGLPAGACGVHAHGAPIERGTIAFPSVGDGNPLIAEIAFDCDFEFFAWKGSSTAAVVADIERTLDAVNLFYERDVDLTHRITQVIVRTSEPDPYSGNDAYAILDPQFRGEWLANQGGVRRDVAHFVTSRDMGNILGLAYVAVTCDPGWHYGLSRFGGDFGTNASVLGHELGHNWSCPHCLDPCDVMCGCGAAAGFGPNDRAQIASFVATRSCLEPLMAELAVQYRLDESGGAVAGDAGPYARHGSFVNGALPGVPSAHPSPNLAARFDGADDHVAIPGGPGLDGLANALSVAFWIKPRAFGGWRFVFGDGASWSAGLFGDRLGFAVRGVRSYLSNQRLVANRWTHVVVTIDPTNGASFFVDGVRREQLAGSVSFPPTGATWFLGAGSATREFVDGEIDDVQVYRGALRDHHVASLFAHPGEPLCTPGFTSYGTGLAGTLGIPGLSGSGIPLVGREITLVAGGSMSFITPGIVVIGLAPTSIPILGGTLLVDPLFTTVIPLLPGNFNTIRIRTPADPTLSCVPIHAQVVEVDAGAAQGFSFTPGLRIVLGG